VVKGEKYDSLSNIIRCSEPVEGNHVFDDHGALLLARRDGWKRNSGRSPHEIGRPIALIGRFRRPTEQELIARDPVFTLFDFALLIDSPSGQAREGGHSGSPSTPASRFPKTIRSGRTRASRRATQTTWPECDREIPNASSQRGG
jgi:hypothetical protein